MSENSLNFQNLPPVIPVFPLEAAILLPGSNLPLNIFEPRYLQMVKDARAGRGIIGMIQPQQIDNNASKPMLYGIGCAGNITHFDETEDGRYIIRLTGVCRFSVDSELDVMTPYRQVQPNWSPFKSDMIAEQDVKSMDRKELMAALKSYLKMKGLAADYEGINTAPDAVLVNTLSMIIPFGSAEKQALLEAEDAPSRGETLQQLLIMLTSATQPETNGQPS